MKCCLLGSGGMLLKKIWDLRSYEVDSDAI